MKTHPFLKVLLIVAILGGSAPLLTAGSDTFGVVTGRGVLPGRTPFNQGVCWLFGTRADYAIGTRDVRVYNGRPCYYLNGRRVWITGAIVNPNDGQPVSIDYPVIRKWNPDGTWKWNWKLGR